MARRENKGFRGRTASVVRPRILVYCGAARTEPDYFEGLRRGLRSLRAVVEVRQKGVAPKQLVGTAAAFVQRNPDTYDAVWCVVDVDEFDIAAAVVAARRQRVHLAVSNPCFELWLLLHHADCRGYCDGYPDVAARLKRHVPTYDKAGLNFADFAGGVDDAVKRGKDLDPTGVEHERNPSTGVWRLVEMIMEK